MGGRGREMSDAKARIGIKNGMRRPGVLSGTASAREQADRLGGQVLKHREQEMGEAALAPTGGASPTGAWIPYAASAASSRSRDESRGISARAAASHGASGVDGENGLKRSDGANAWNGSKEEIEASAEVGSATEAGPEVANSAGKGGEAGVSGGAGPDLNQSLARLEMNSLEVKLYLDSIDQRISRMEPRLEEMRTAEPASAPVGSPAAPVAVPASGAAAPTEERSVAEAGPQGYTTTERRRRAQGVPVDRRRPPHMVPHEDEIAPRWRWRPWLATYTARLGRLPLPRGGRAWAPLAVVGLLLVGGLVFWSLGRHTGSRAQPPPVDAGSMLAGAVPNGRPKGLGEVPGSPAAGTQAGGAQATLGGNRSGAGRAATTTVEQGVAVPLPPGFGPPVPGPTTSLSRTSSGSQGSAGAIPLGGTAESAGTATKPSAAVGSSNDTVLGTAPGDAAMAESRNADEAVAGGSSAGGVTNGANGSGGSNGTSGSNGTNGSRSGSSVSGRIVPPPSARRINVSSGVMAGNLIYSRQPAYPKGFAGLFHSEGNVVMQAIVSKSGQVENLRVISGHYILRGAAKEAVRTWRYRPYYINGRAVEVATIVSVEFHR